MTLSHLIKTTAVILPVLAAAVPAYAAATQVVTLQSDNFVLQRNGSQLQRLLSVNASTGTVLPTTCVAGATSSFAQCAADLFTAGFTAVNSFDTTSINGAVTPYFIFKK
jgi:hypothetical protein